MTKAEAVVRELSEMYDIYMEFRQAREKAGMPMESPIPGMTLEEFHELRRTYFEEEHQRETNQAIDPESLTSSS